MAAVSAKDVQALRRSTGAGMMDAKRALEEAGGDMDQATKALRESGLAKAASRSDRENRQGAVAVGRAGEVASIVELKSETDFVAKSADFTNLVDELADTVAREGEDALERYKAEVDELKVTLKENIEVGEVVRFEPAAGNIVDSYLHNQAERGVNAVLVELTGDDRELAHDVAIHVAFTRPDHLTREDVPEEEIEQERQVLEAETRNEGKPEQAIPKIVEGKLNGRFFAERVLLDQKFVRDEKQTVRDLLGDAEIVRYAQVVVG